MYDRETVYNRLERERPQKQSRKGHVLGGKRLPSKGWMPGS